MGMEKLLNEIQRHFQKPVKHTKQSFYKNRQRHLVIFENRTPS